MNKLTKEEKSNLLQQKISMTQATTLYNKAIKNGGKVFHLFWGTQQYLGLKRKRCPEIGKSKSDIFQEPKVKTCTIMQLLY